MAGPSEFERAPLPADLDRLLHDLRGPLNAAVMHLELLKRLCGDDAAALTSLVAVQQDIDRLAAMLPVAFGICALERGPTRPLALRAVVESAIDEPMRKRIQVEPGAWPEVEGDERLLVLGVRHVLLNALEAGDPDSQVRVSLEPADEGRVAVVVHDAGAGFKTRNASAIVRLMAGTKPGHMGVGLLVAQRAARLHGGALTFDTAGTGGGVVRFVLRARA